MRLSIFKIVYLTIIAIGIVTFVCFDVWISPLSNVYIITLIAAFAGGAGAGNRGLTKIGLTNVKRTWNALTHKGAKVALEVLGQGLTYFGKNAQHMVKPLVAAIAKSSGSVIINNTVKVMIA